MENEERIICNFKEDGGDFKYKLAHIFEDYLKQTNEPARGVENFENTD